MTTATTGEAKARRPTSKRAACVDAYLGPATGNAADAARIAGYRTPEQEGHRLRNCADMAPAIAERTASRAVSAEAPRTAREDRHAEPPRRHQRDPETGRRVYDHDRAFVTGAVDLSVEFLATEHGRRVERPLRMEAIRRKIRA